MTWIQRPQATEVAPRYIWDKTDVAVGALVVVISAEYDCTVAGDHGYPGSCCSNGPLQTPTASLLVTLILVRYGLVITARQI